MCLMWIGVISLGIVIFIGTTVSTGWIIAGVLSLAMVVGLVVISREVRNAPEMPDDFDSCELSGHRVGQAEFYGQRVRIRGSRIGNRGTTARIYDRIMPRRVRAHQNRPRASELD